MNDYVASHAYLERRMADLGRELSAPMGGGPGSIYAVHALDAVDQFLPSEA